jgi:hypothetical protein
MIRATVRATGGMIGGGAGPAVWTAGGVAGSVRATAGPLVVESWGAVGGDVSTVGGLAVWAYGDVWAELYGLTAQVGSWGSVTHRVQGLQMADVRAFADVGGDSDAMVRSEAGPVTVWAGGSVIRVDLIADAYAGLSFAGTAISVRSDVWVMARYGSVGGDEIAANDLVQLTAGQDITTPYIHSTGNMVLDAGRAISGVQSAVAKKNLWASARGGSLSAALRADVGWAYAWAYHDVSGSVSATDTVSVTAWRDLTAHLISSTAGVDAYAGRNVTGALTGKHWVDLEARGDISAHVTAGDAVAFGDAVVRTDGDVTGGVSSTGSVNIAAGGDVLCDVSAGEGWLEIVANGDVRGALTAGEEATVWTGAEVHGSVTAELDVDVRADGDIHALAESRQGDTSVWAGGDFTGLARAKRDVVVEAVGTVGATVSGGAGATVLANGNIDGSVEADWVADVRSSAGRVNATVTTRKNDWDRLNDPESPTKKRIDVINDEIAKLRQQIAAGVHPSVLPGLQAMIAEREAELELHRFGSVTLDYQRIPASAIRGLLSSGLAKEYDGNSYRGRPTRGYVALADSVGTDGYFMLLEPFGLRFSGVDGDTELYERSILGETSASGSAIFYKVVKRFAAPHEGDPKAFRDGLLTDASVKANVEGLVDNIVTGHYVPLLKTLEFAMRLVPVVGGLDDFVQGRYLEGALSLLGDAAMIGGLGLALAARNCTYTGARLIKFGNIAAASIEGGIAATRLGQGFHALGGGHTAEAWGYFGDATLRLLGLSAQAVSLLRKPKCFVAGTPVHAEGGSKPIEAIRVGDRVWAYDRQAQEWRLCPVTQTARRMSDRLTTLRLERGEELTGTEDHPFWVIEGERLPARPVTRHGADEPAGPTPGRWVAMADLRHGDVVLTRLGEARRVASAVTRAEAVPVYNLEIAGLHSYAVGDAGVLVHNGPDCALTEDVVAVTKEAATKGAKPKVRVGDPAAGPLASTPTGSTKAAKAPKKKTSTPSTEAADHSGKYVQPTVNGLTYRKPATVRIESPVAVTPDELNILKPHFEAHTAAQAAGDSVAAAKAARTIGEEGAQQFMKTNVPKAKWQRTGKAGHNDLDFIYFDEASKTYYVVEAKGITNQRRARNVAPVGEAKQFAEQGSKEYLDGTLLAMKNSGDSVRESWAKKPEDARDGVAGMKLIYLEVGTKKKGRKGPYYKVTYFRE